MIIAKKWKRHWGWWAAMSAAVVLVVVFAGTSSSVDPASDDRLYSIAEELKCLQCVGESVAASQSSLAQQFRDEIRTQMDAGATDQEIFGFFTNRYGDEVLLTPQTDGPGLLVWVLPVVLVAGALLGFTAMFARNADQSWVKPVSYAAIGIFVLVLGAVLWLGVGDRGGGNITGIESIDADLRACQNEITTSPQDGIDCYAEVLTEDPDNAEALTYRGWAKVRSGDPAGGSVDLERALVLSPEYTDALVFSAVAFADQADFAAAQEALAGFFATDPPESMLAIVASQQLEEKIFFGSMSSPAQKCWGLAAESGAEDAFDQEFLDSLGQCAANELLQSPDDRDLLLARAIALLGPDIPDAEAALVIADQLLAADANDVDAHTVATVALALTGDSETAQQHVDILEAAHRAPTAFMLGDAATLNELVSSASGSDPATPSIPNLEGG